MWGFWVLMFAAFFLPTIVALCTGKRRVLTFVVNLVLGPTVIGWVVAMAIALW